MTSNHKAMLGFTTVLSILLFLILGVSLDWPRWSWSILAVTVLSTLAASVIRTHDDPYDTYVPPAPSAPPPSPVPRYREHRVERVALPSAVPDYHFEFSATVRWYGADTEDSDPVPLDEAALAAGAVLARAQSVARREHPSQVSLTQHLLSSELSIATPDDRRMIMAMARDVSLALPEPDRDRLAKLAEVRKNEDVWEHERHHERNKRAYLGDDVLKNPGSAVVWWLAKNDNDVRGTVDLIGLLTHLTAAANNEDVVAHFGPPPHSAEPLVDAPLTESERSVVEALVDLMGSAGVDSDDMVFVDQIIKNLENAGRPGAADEIRRAFAPDEGPDD